MTRLDQLKLEDIVTEETLKKYEYIAPLDITLSEYIFRYLNSKPGFIKSTKIKEYSNTQIAHYVDQINDRVLRGKPIEVFFSTFNPKSRKLRISNNQIYPDMGEFLSFIHLTLIGKYIRNVYSPGFRFIILYEGSYFRDGGNIELKDTKKIYEILQYFVQQAERMVGIRNVIELKDLQETVDTLGNEFTKSIQKTEKDIMNDAKEKQRIADISSYLIKEVVEVSFYPSEKIAYELAFKHVLFSEAFAKVKYKGGKFNLGIRKDYPESIPATVKLMDHDGKESLKLQLMPNEETYPYNRLTARTKDGSWKLVRWEHIANECEFVYFEEFNYPFYYKLK